MDIYVLDSDGQQTGPYSVQEIRTRLRNKTFTSLDLAWAEGMSQWQPISRVILSLPPVIPVQRPIAPPPPYRSRSPIIEPPLSLVIWGYVLAAGSLIICPPVLAAGAIACGIILITKGGTTHGVAIISIAFFLACIGMLAGAMMGAISALQ